jgi:hypothetical protein
MLVEVGPGQFDVATIASVNIGLTGYLGLVLTVLRKIGRIESHFIPGSFLYIRIRHCCVGNFDVTAFARKTTMISKTSWEAGC